MEQDHNDLMPLQESPVERFVGELAPATAPEGQPEGSSPMKRVVAAVVAAIVVLIIAFPVGDFASSPDTYAHQIASLDAKAGNVTALVASSTAASVAITLLPDDIGSPIADKLVDLAADFAIVLGAIYLEKYLLTILGLAACRVVAPVAGIFFVVAVLHAPGSPARGKGLAMTLRLVLFGVALALVIPASVGVSDMIEATYNYDVSGVATQMDSGVQASDDSASGDAAAQGDSAAGSASDSSGSGNTGNLFDQFVDWAGGLADQAGQAASAVAQGITSGVTGVLDAAKSWVASLVEAFAVMIVTCCVIPILVLFFFVWLINVLLGIDVKLPSGAAGKMKAKLPRPGAKKA